MPLLKLISNECEYQAALKKIEEAWDPEPGTPEAEAFERLCNAVVEYEKRGGGMAGSRMNRKIDPKRGEADIFVVRVDKRGRITIPLPIRQKLGIAPGDVVSLEIQGNTIVLKKVIKKAVEKVHRKFGSLLKKLAE